MKKVITFIMLFVALFLVISPVTALAAEVADEVAGGEATYHDIFTRIWEFVETNKTEVISAAGSGVLLIFSAITKAWNKKKNKEITDALKIIGSDAAGTASSQTSVIEAMNGLISGYNEMRVAYEENKSAEADRNRLVGACLVAVTALLEMNENVYVHNKNIPQGVKDLVVLEYANTKKALLDDEVLKEVVEAVRAKITVAEEAATDEEQD